MARRWLENHQEQLEEAVTWQKAEEIAASTNELDVHVETLIAASTTVADSNLPADESEACQVNSYKDVDNQDHLTHILVEITASKSEPYGYIERLMAASNSDKASTVAPKTKLDADTVLPEQMPRDAFRLHYKLNDNQSYGDAVKKSSEEVYWTAPDGRKW